MLFYYFDTESLLLKYAQKKLKLWHNQGLQNPKVCLLKVNIFKESLIRKSTLMTLFTGLGPQVSVPLTVMAPWPLSEPFTDPCCYPHLMRSVKVIIFFLFPWPFLSLLILRYRWPQSDKISQAHSAHFNAHWVTSERPSNITGHQAYLNRF